MADVTDMLDRGKAVPALVGDLDDVLVIAGLAGTARDIADLGRDRPNYFALAGVMGAALPMGLGLALARPDKRVLVATGDGELLMNMGALATVGVKNPPNLAILCVDNERYGETGWQESHTGQGVDLEKIAAGAGIRITRTVRRADELADGARLLRESNGSVFVLVKVGTQPSPPIRRSFDGALARLRFRAGLLGPE